MSATSRRAPRALIALVATWLAAGCSRSLLTSPEPTPEPATVAAAATVMDTTPPPPSRLALATNLVLPLPIPQLNVLNWSVVCQVLVRKDRVQDVSASHYDLVFAKGSLASDTTVTIKEYDSNVLDFQLGPHGIQFPVPVELSIDFSNTSCDPGSDIADGREPVLYWLNDKTNRWEEVPGRVDWERHRLIVPLRHFSRYVVGGKAGWKQGPPSREDD